MKAFNQRDFKFRPRNTEQSHNHAADIGMEIRSEFVIDAKEASSKQPFLTAGELVKCCLFSKRTTAAKSKLPVVNHAVRAINREKEKLFPKIDMTEPN
jgi:hypothetical protein